LVRFLLIFFNALFVLAGFSLLAISVWALADEKSLRSLIQTRLFTMLALAGLAVAVIAICSGLLGCFGAVKGIRWMTIVFGALLLLFLIITLGAVLTLYIFRGIVGREIKGAMVKSLKSDYSESPANHRFYAIKDTWDWLQQTLRCCGVRHNNSAGYYAWHSSRWFRETSSRENATYGNVTSGFVPPSCCVPSAPGIVVDPEDPSTFANRDKCLGINAYFDFRGPPRLRILSGAANAANEAIFVDGCYHAFRSLVADEWNLVIVVTSVVALIAIEVIGLGLTCHLCRRLRSREQIELENFSKGRALH